ncbi:hypothetical protein CTTA_3482 [Comamonas testosteroni]|uniref:Uncharacterized protein n=1 Tax=Comamonas testosteroni TaxID=285 RepID=A0A5A7MF89_COMTE|nr:hypothetical protein [Comamonas testosteroni]GEQ76477.1 hypothetical protein CTTA_3482 [Comamonas testosteroni]
MTELTPRTVPKAQKKRNKGAQAEYNKLVQQWGREIANEIMLKRARAGAFLNKPVAKKKKGPDLLDAKWARASGSYESSRKR